MRSHFHRYFFLLLPLLVGCSEGLRPQTATNTQTAAPTVVYVVRHAEKMTDNPAEKDPELTAAGHRRAEDLKAHLAGVEIQALFSTAYRRTHQTLAPLAREHNLTIQTYAGNDYGALAERIYREYGGQTVMIAGHSNTVLEIAEAFGAQRPMAEIADHAYNNLFRISKQGTAPSTVEALQYGQPNPVPKTE